MRLIVVFAPVFLEWPKAVINEMQARDPSIEVVAIANTRVIYDDLIKSQKEGRIKFHAIECFEDQVREWLSKPYDPELMKFYEQKYGQETIFNVAMADRQLMQGYMSSAVHDSTEFIKLIEDHDKKRAYICGQIDYFTKLFDRYQIDAALYHAIATAFTVAMTELLEARGGKNLLIAHSRVDNLMLIDTCPKGFLASVARRICAGENPAPESLEKAREWLNAYRAASNKEPDYMAYLRQAAKSAFSLKGVFRNIAYSFVDWVRYGQYPTLFARTGWQKVKDNILLPCRYYIAQKLTRYVDFEKYKTRPYIYYALHVDPEASTMHMAPHNANQLTVIEALAKQKPMHMDLLIKEHPAMIGMRPAGFYRKLAAMPGVYLVNPAIPSLTMIRNAKLVATITGTVAWESILLKTPVLVVGDSPFLHNKGLDEGVLYHRDITSLIEPIERAMKRSPTKDEDITRFLGILFEESFPLDVTLIWKNNLAKHVEQNREVVAMLAEAILVQLQSGSSRQILRKAGA